MRLTAVEATLLQQPLITGEYSAAAHHWLSEVSGRHCVSFAERASGNVWGVRCTQTCLQTQDVSQIHPWKRHTAI